MRSENSDIWCQGELLEAVQRSGIFADSKHFVDKALKGDPNEAFAAFHKLSGIATNGKEYKAALEEFLKEHFEGPGSELQGTQADDFVPEPRNFLPLVRDASVRKWALAVHALWNQLHRKAHASGKSNTASQRPQKHSLLCIPNAVVVPGQRFRELYYWDTYWILKGLLVSGMRSTATGMVNNLLHLLHTYGLVPNGSRTYYLNRSQPPLLSAMVRELAAGDRDMKLLRAALPLLIREHDYWTSSPKAVNVALKEKTHSLSRYYAAWSHPRPESFREDEATAAGLPNEQKSQLYCQLASAAESGWDFSSRWLANGRTLATIRTTQIIPVDLNAFLYDMEVNIGDFAAALGDLCIARTFEAAAAARSEAIQTLMWDTATGQWRDLVIESTSASGVARVTHSSCNSAANYVPIWAGLVSEGSDQVKAALKSFKASGLLGVAGVSATTVTTGQQWDAPNAWPPIQELLIQGFTAFGGTEGRQLAGSIAQRWLHTMLSNWSSQGRSHHRMLEKYDAYKMGGSGGGGEYNVQFGFGWTNGVMLVLLAGYGWQPGRERLIM